MLSSYLFRGLVLNLSFIALSGIVAGVTHLAFQAILMTLLMAIGSIIWVVRRHHFRNLPINLVLLGLLATSLAYLRFDERPPLVGSLAFLAWSVILFSRYLFSFAHSWETTSATQTSIEEGQVDATV